MFESITRGWGIAKTSAAVLKRNLSLVLLPIYSTAACALLLAVVGGFIYVIFGHDAVTGTAPPPDAADDGGALAVEILVAVIALGAFVIYLASAFFVTFFNAALVACAVDAFDGRTPTVRAGTAAALRRLPQIVGWSIVAATVGLFLNIVQSLLDKLGILGALLDVLLQTVWSVVTYFVMPVVVVEGAGPVKAIKRSSTILKQTWGEALGGGGGLGFIAFLFLLPVSFFIGVFNFAKDVPTVVMVVIAAVLALYVVVVSLIFAALSTIFRTGVYIYATTGQVPSAIDPALLQSAFRPKR